MRHLLNDNGIIKLFFGGHVGKLDIKRDFKSQ